MTDCALVGLARARGSDAPARGEYQLFAQGDHLPAGQASRRDHSYAGENIEPREVPQQSAGAAAVGVQGAAELIGGEQGAVQAGQRRGDGEDKVTGRGEYERVMCVEGIMYYPTGCQDNVNLGGGT